jgi:hypothetical protein
MARAHSTIVEEIVRTCSNPRVAGAALISIGATISAEFVKLFIAEAAQLGLRADTFAAQHVRAFGERASSEARAHVERVAQDADQPILSGLLFILGLGLVQETFLSMASDQPASGTEAAGR